MDMACTKFVCVFIVYLRTKFYIRSSNGLLVIVMKQKAKYTFRSAAILFVRVKQSYRNACFIFFHMKYHIYVKWRCYFSHLRHLHDNDVGTIVQLIL
jgi:hypothetical protein